MTMTPQHLRPRIDLMRRNLARLGEPKLAIAASADYDFGMVRMFQMTPEDEIPYDLMVFRKVEQACDWLGLDPARVPRATEDGRLYYVMALLEGIDLEELVQRFGHPPAERVVYILGQACESLSEAHRRGLVHRDVKPGNIFLCQHAFRFDVVKLLDFGLAKHTRLSPGDARLSRADTIHGSPAYMAPEVALGTKEVDGRADIYGLGCVAYWPLTGSLVFDAPSPTAMIVAHVKEQPVPPSRRSELFVSAEVDDW